MYTGLIYLLQLIYGVLKGEEENISPPPTVDSGEGFAFSPLLDNGEGSPC